MSLFNTPSTSSSIDFLRQESIRRLRTVKDRVKEWVGMIKFHVWEILSSRLLGEAATKLQSFWIDLFQNDLVFAFGRFCICLFFLNSVYESYEMYDMAVRVRLRRQIAQRHVHFRQVPFPYLRVILVVPCAILTALKIQVPLCGSVLVVEMLWESAQLIVSTFRFFVLYGNHPNELVAKRLCVVGCTILMVVTSLKESFKPLSFAGQLISDKDKNISHKKSFLLLLGRILVTIMFVCLGYSQVKRVIARDWALWNDPEHDHWDFKDGHDNNWLLLEFLMSFPFLFGYKLQLVSQLLSIVLMLEAITCWPFWSSLLPHPGYASHMRLHFVTNLAVSGGLLLLQRYGAGKYTIDHLINKKKL